MWSHHLFTTVTRISDLSSKPFETTPLSRREWETGDYVVAEVFGRPSALYFIETCNGRLVQTVPGDLVVGALGQRAATLEGVGSWQAVGPNLEMEALTSAGLFGKATSISPVLPRLMSIRYVGHVTRDGKIRMADFVNTVPRNILNAPVIMIIGTSMSAGKTTTGRVIVRELKCAGLKVVAAKITGAARYRDTLSFSDAGADEVFDFVDVGLPSTVCPSDQFKTALDQLLSRIATIGPDVVVTEAGASPLEPYNGTTACELLKPLIKLTVLCASDPYAVLGVKTAFAVEPELISGPAANTDAAIALVEKLTGARAVNLNEEDSKEVLRSLLKKKLKL